MESETVQSLRVIYSLQSPPQQIHTLCLLSFYLTLNGRSFYLPGTSIEQASKALRTINEIQHSISSQLLPLLADDQKRYPDDVFINIVIEKSDDLYDAVVRDLGEALRQASKNR
jgi:hypothetical protein